MSVLCFRNQESEYLNWLASNPHGFVLNSHSHPKPNYLVLHRAGCRTIGSKTAASDRPAFTGNGYIKTCANTISDLSVWLSDQGLPKFSQKCRLCNPKDTRKAKRLNWTHDELVLALELYFNAPSARGNERHPEVVALSELLQKLPIHPLQGRPPSFRNPSGVSMKLSNFLAYDPDYAGNGLEQGAKAEKEVWDQFASRKDRLREVANAIRNHFGTLPQNVNDESEDDGVTEGGILIAVHKRYERNRSIILKKKKAVLEKHRTLRCEVCDFDFSEVYGELGNDFAECHHTKPVSQMQPGDTTTAADLSIVCANCHRMLHRGREWMSIVALKKVFEKEKELSAIKGTYNLR